MCVSVSICVYVFVCTHAGGQIPRNANEVVWRASTLEPAHGQTGFVLHGSGAASGTFVGRREGEVA